MKRPTQRRQLHSRISTFLQHASTSQALSSQERSHHVSQLSHTDSVVTETISPSIAGEGQPLSDDQQDFGDHDINEMEQQLERSADGSQSRRHREAAVPIARRYKKCRGTLQYDVPNQTELIVVKSNAFKQPIGKTAGKVSTEIGIIARDGSKVPLLLCKWPKISQNVKETFWKIILAKFSFQNCTEKTKKVSAQNKANRAQLKMIHRCGTMSFTRKWEEEREKNPNGQEPDRMHMFYVTYTLSDGFPSLKQQGDIRKWSN